MPASQDSLRLIEGTATYRGMASFLKTSGYLSSSQWIYGEVMLNANFDNSTTMGTISGNISNFELPPQSSNDARVNNISLPGLINLEETNIGTSNSRFFDGSVTGTFPRSEWVQTSHLSPSSQDPGTYDIEGTWGSIFWR